jgi:phenylacetate-CoA ligase
MAGKFIERLYYNSPIWLQNIFVSGQGLLFRYRRANERILRAQFEFLLRSEHWTTEQFRDYQVQQLRHLLHIAFNHVPYYRDLQKKLGCDLEDFKRPEDIRLLPTLAKSQVRNNESIFLNEQVDLRKCYKGSTSGTTGTPITTYASQEAFSTKWAFVSRLRHWAGLKDPFYPKRAQFTGRFIVPPEQAPDKHVYWRSNIPGKSLLFSSFHISPETIPYYVKALRDFNPESIEGFPSAMLIIARVNRRLGLILPRPKAIIATAETLLPEHRQELQEAFGCQVFNYYSASEPSSFWCECGNSVMHENPESGISEIIDKNGKPVNNGDAGEVAVTAFHNPVMILIRYRLGDIAFRADQEKCLCGRQMPIIKNLLGRKEDILFIPERGYVTGTVPFSGISKIIEAQIIQEDLSHIMVLVVPGYGYNQEEEIRLRHNLHMQLGESVNITVNKVEAIPCGPGGKFRPIISKVQHLYPDDMRLY